MPCEKHPANSKPSGFENSILVEKSWMTQAQSANPNPATNQPRHPSGGKSRKPAMIVTESLDIRGKAKSKEMSRLVSYWMRGSLKERLDFLALVEGFRHKQVNPAYTSQMCPTCLFVHKDNRRGDIFQVPELRAY